MKPLTLAEWHATHADYRSVIDGQPYVLTNGAERGTILEPVALLPDPTPRFHVRLFADGAPVGDYLITAQAGDDAITEADRIHTTYARPAWTRATVETTP